MSKSFIPFFILIFISNIAIGQKTISLDDIWKRNTFGTQGISGFSSMADGAHYTEIENGKLLKKSFQTGKTVSEYSFYKDLSYQNSKLKISHFEFNNKEDKMLLFTEPEMIYRHSALYKVYVYDIQSANLQLVDTAKILHATFSPQSDKIAFVKNNNLYYKNLETAQVVEITKDGKDNIINGNCDWVYEEEFGFTKAFEWSPDGDAIAFYRFDQSAVPEFTMMYFNNLYPEKYEFKYPKAGEANSTIKIGIYKIANQKTDFVKIDEEYIPRIKWTQYDKKLIIYTLNRHQNNLKFYAIDKNSSDNSVYDPSDDVIKSPLTLIYEEKNDAYIDISDQITFLKNQNAFLYTSEKDGFNHIYLHDISSNKSQQITKGNWEVTELYGINEDSKTIYYSSTEYSPLERNLFSINLNGKNKNVITKMQGYHEISFTNNFKYFIDQFSSTEIPTQFILKDNLGNEVRKLKDNNALLDKIKAYDVAPLELMQIPVGKEILNAWMIKPKHMETGKKYPLIMFQYSGPGSQQVNNRWGTRDIWWYQMMAQKGYVIACVDGRGTGFRGEAFKKCTYKQLGKLESDDQIDAAKYFGTLPFIDKNRIGIWGWSYGGYMSSICIAKGNDIFKAAIAVAPVTNWRYYDNIYTERYMQTPQENPDGYDDNSPINMVSKIKGNYLLIHGSGDDNVHYQNTMQMINAMINANVQFDSEIYPNKNHGIYGGNTRFHLYNRMTQFWLEKL